LVALTDLRIARTALSKNSMILDGKQVAVLGAGRSGQAAAKLAHKAGASVCVYDAGAIRDDIDLPESVMRVSNASEDVGKTTQCDVLVISPGIDTYGSYVAAFSQGAREVIGEVELATRFFDGKIVAITGTNGKTTTTELVQRIIEHSGMSCAACGNYGIPVAEVVMGDVVPEVLALEVSSFQLETIKDFCPEVAIWLNFDADHMDRYTSLEDYKNAKLRIFKNQTAQHVAVVREGEDVGDIDAAKVSFTSENNNADYTVDGLCIMHGSEAVIDLMQTRMRGLHNAENVMAAAAAAVALGVTHDQVLGALQGFAPPLHRCELIRTLDGVEYINDSKATNLHALDSALRSQFRPVVLIAGGKEKGLDYAPLLGRLKEKVHDVIVFGEICNALHDVFSESVPTHQVATLEEAVKLSQQLSSHGDTVLFSPGTSSFDMFAGYEARGDAFRTAVQALK